MPKKKLAFNSDSARKSREAIERLDRHQARMDEDVSWAGDSSQPSLSSPSTSPSQPASHVEQLRESAGERVRVLADAGDGRDFARELLDPARRDVAVVIAAFEGIDFVDLDVLLDDVDPNVRLALAASTAASAGLIEELARATSNGQLGVGAQIARVYGYGGAWWIRQVPRIEVRSTPVDHARYIAHVVRRCEQHSTAAAYSRSESRQVAPPRLVTGTAGLYDGEDYRAYVTVDGQIYTLNLASLDIDSSLVVTDLLSAGVEVQVRVNDADRAVTAIPGLVSSEELASQVRADTAVLARIHAIGPYGKVEVAPGKTIPLCGVSDSFSVGQILPVALLDDGDGLRAEFTFEEDLSDAVSYIPGGPSWLQAAYEAQERENAQEYAREIADGDGGGVEPHDVISVIEHELERLRRAIDQAFDEGVAESSAIDIIEQQDKREEAYRMAIRNLKQQLHTQQTETTWAKDEASRLRDLVENLEKRVRRAEQNVAVYESQIERLSRSYTPEQLQALTAPKSQEVAPSPSRDDRRWEALITGQEFLSDEDQLRFEIEVMWGLSLDAEEKEAWPIRPYTFSENFFETLRTVGRQLPRRKLLRVLTQVVTRKSREGSHAHVLDKRSGKHGGMKPQIRKDGAILRRVRLEHSTHAARRLFYWLHTDGTVELSAIAVHDDYDGYN